MPKPLKIFCWFLLHKIMSKIMKKIDSACIFSKKIILTILNYSHLPEILLVISADLYFNYDNRAVALLFYCLCIRYF